MSDLRVFVDVAAQRFHELEEENMKLRLENEELSGRLQDAEMAARRYNQHLTLCAVADALDQEDNHKRLADV